MWARVFSCGNIGPGTLFVRVMKPQDHSKNLPGVAALLLAGTGTIEAMEKEGQEEAVAGQSLPSDSGHEGDKTDEEYKALGFVFGDPFDDDPIWRPVQLPEGWSFKRTGHSMHNDIVDENGNKRGSFFYKAAFYDRRAILYPPSRRYKIEERRDDDDWYPSALVIDVIDNVTGSTLYSESRGFVTKCSDGDGHDRRSEYYGEKRQHSESAKKGCRDWLAENFPDYENAGAYWGD